MKLTISSANLSRLQKRGNMKSSLVFPVLLAGLLSALTIPILCCGGAADPPATPQAEDPRPASYTITDLGTLPGGTFSSAAYINNNGLVVGSSTDVDGNSHAVLWVGGQIEDISTPGLGGPNSGAVAIGANGQAGGFAESSDSDPNTENFCDLFPPTGLKCLPFVWQKGVMSALPLLGGNNGEVNLSNNQGEMVGVAENNTKDSQCPSTPYLNGVGPQVLDFEAVIWGPNTGQMRQLNPLSGDTVAGANGINNMGQVVGASGSCADTYPPPFAAAQHAVLWDADGSVHDLGNLGGTLNPDVLGLGNVAFAINDQGQVTGCSPVAPSPGSSVSTAFHAFFWTQKTGMQDLGTLPGDVVSCGLDMNGLGVVVGASLDAPPPTGNPSAVIWQNGAITNLNDVVAANTSLYLLTAFDINNAGQIVGFGFDPITNEVHAFLASPIPGGGPAARKAAKRPAMSENVRQFVQQHGVR
jgi:probable HAF family extracellular repeat protein